MTNRLKILSNRKPKIIPYDPTREYDFVLSKLVDKIRKLVSEEDDDVMLALVGPRGSGKSRLMMHIYEEFDKEGAHIKYIGLNRVQFANGLKAVKGKKGLRFLANDEANVSKRDSMTKYNKDLIDLYFSIRGKNIFHVWCNPSVDILDKVFIEDNIRGLILMFDKSKNIRTYWYFKKVDLLKIYEVYGNLKISSLVKARTKLAWYRGWCKVYNGRLLKPYQVMKDARMDDKIDLFHEAWGSNDRMTRAAVAKELGRTTRSVRMYEADLLKRGLLIEGDNFFRDEKGNVSYSGSALILFLDCINTTGITGVARKSAISRVSRVS